MIFTIVVTYSNRFYLLRQVVDAAMNEGVDKVIVVDNDSFFDSKMKLRDYAEKHKEKIILLPTDENLGSAGGFKKGLHVALGHPQCRFVWLLDDDSMPQRGALAALLDFWHTRVIEADNTILMSLRIDRGKYYEAIINDEPSLLIGDMNSFITFDLISFLKLKFLKNKIRKNKNNKEYGTVPVAPYGGMFLHRSLIDRIGYPDESFFVYADDTDFSYRVIKNGGKIYALFKSLVEDIDTSWDEKKYIKSFFSSTVLDSPDDFRIYYSFRNRVYFEINNRVDNKFIYFMNMFFSLSNLLIISILRFKMKRFKLVLIAIREGLNGRLGKL